MPTTITSTSGESYHLWQLPNLCAPEPEFGIGYTTIENEMCQGYRSSSLLGLNTGVRTFALTLPTISAYGTSYTDPYGATVTRHEYLRNLFKYNQTTGIPFAYQHPDTEQYYLVDFADSEITFGKVRGATIYQTNVNLKQRRINGETIFSIPKMTYGASPYSLDWYDETSHSSGWTDIGTGGASMTASGDVVFSSNAQNGHNTVKLNGSSTNGSLSISSQFGAPVRDIVFVMKMRETTFSSNSNIWVGNSGSTVYLRGTSGGTKFQNPSITGLQYFLNGTEYAQSDMQAPMDTWGVVHLRFPLAVAADPSNSTFGSSNAKVSFGEIITFGNSHGLAEMYELTEHYQNKWGVTT